MTIPTVPAEIMAARSALEAALAERQRLDALAAQLRKDGPGVTEAQATTRAAFDELETDVALAGDAVPAGLLKRHEAARVIATEADLAAKRHQRIAGAMPAKLAAADGEIEAASTTFRAAVEPFRQAVISAYADELAAAARVFVRTLNRGYAIGEAMGIGFASRFDELHIPAGAPGHANLILGSRHYDEGGDFIDLRTTWRTQPDLAALHAELRPFGEVTRRAADHARRIAGEREREVDAANAAARAAGPRRTSTGASVPPAAARSGPPTPRFIPNSYTLSR